MLRSASFFLEKLHFGTSLRRFLSFLYHLETTRMYGLYDRWVGDGADFSLCLCLRCLASHSKFHPVGHVGSVELTLWDWSHQTPHPSHWHDEVIVKTGENIFQSEQPIQHYHWPRIWRIFWFWAGVNDQGCSLDMVMFPDTDHSPIHQHGSWISGPGIIINTGSKKIYATSTDH